jgi:SP family general alpha glucoside:H+ symporter-like MFS transporter
MWRLASTLIGNLGWAFVAETGSSRLRAKTAGIAAAGGVCLGLVFNTTTWVELVAVGADFRPYMLNANAANWGLKTAFFYAGISTPFVVASFFIIPDTSRRTPAELDEMFRKKVRPWRFRSYVTDAQKALDAERERTGETDPALLQRG